VGVSNIFGDSTIKDPLLRRLVLKVAISSEALIHRDIDFKSAYFGDPDYDIHAYIAKFVERYADSGEYPGFDLLRYEIQNADVRTSAFTKDDVLSELQAIEEQDIGAFSKLAEEFVNFVRNHTALRAIRKAYSKAVLGNTQPVEPRAVVEELVREVDSVEKLSRGAFIDKLSLITRPKREHFLLGLPSLDQHTQGICRGEFFLFLGAPKGRKTSFLSTATIGALVSNPDAKVMFVSFEMTLESMKERFALSMDTFARARGYTGPSDIADVAKFLGVDKRFYVFYAEPGSSISQLKRVLDRLKSTDGFVPDVIFLDYMVFMQPQMKRSEKRHELAEIARDCVRLASQYNAGVVSAHLLKRESLEKGREITRADISESYEVIAVVDAAIAIAVEKENSATRPKYHLKIVAGRRFEDDCLVGTFSAAYDGVTMEEIAI
jgi:hypothetical protein